MKICTILVFLIMSMFWAWFNRIWFRVYLNQASSDTEKWFSFYRIGWVVVGWSKRKISQGIGFEKLFINRGSCHCTSCQLWLWLIGTKFITNWGVGQLLLLQIVTGITNCKSLTTNRGMYYKLEQISQIGAELQQLLE